MGPINQSGCKSLNRGGSVVRMRLSMSLNPAFCTQVNGGPEVALKAVKQSKVFTSATSFGGVESLIEHRYSIEGEGSSVPRDWRRLSIGIESVQDLLADLD